MQKIVIVIGSRGKWGEFSHRTAFLHDKFGTDVVIFNHVALKDPEEALSAIFDAMATQQGEGHAVVGLFVDIDPTATHLTTLPELLTSDDRLPKGLRVFCRRHVVARVRLRTDKQGAFLPDRNSLLQTKFGPAIDIQELVLSPGMVHSHLAELDSFVGRLEGDCHHLVAIELDTSNTPLATALWLLTQSGDLLDGVEIVVPLFGTIHHHFSVLDTRAMEHFRPRLEPAEDEDEDSMHEFVGASRLAGTTLQTTGEMLVHSVGGGA